MLSESEVWGHGLGGVWPSEKKGDQSKHSGIYIYESPAPEIYWFLISYAGLQQEYCFSGKNQLVQKRVLF